MYSYTQPMGKACVTITVEPHLSNSRLSVLRLSGMMSGKVMLDCRARVPLFVV